MRSSAFCLAIGFIVALAGCGGARSTRQVSASKNTGNVGNQAEGFVAPNGGILTATAERRPVPDYLELPAQIQADPTRVVHVYPPAGGRIIEMKVHPWQWVEQGQTLAILESPELSRAVADYHVAIADFQVKQEALNRSEDLLAHHAIAMKDYQQAQADFKASEAELDAAREEIRALGMDPAHASTRLTLTAPRSGVILDVSGAQGEYSNALAAAQPLCTIADLSSVWAVGDIYEKDLAVAQAGEAAQVTLDAYPSEKWSGRVSVVSDAVDPTTRTLHVRVVLANPGARLKPGMFGQIQLLRSSAERIVLPAAAVIREGNTAYVFASAGSGRYKRVPVELGPMLSDGVEVNRGLKPGETIVTQGALLLRAAAQN